jgi:hypothetical protein
MKYRSQHFQLHTFIMKTPYVPNVWFDIEAMVHVVDGIIPQFLKWLVHY